MSEVKYKRVILKLSGEALAGEKGFGIRETCAMRSAGGPFCEGM